MAETVVADRVILQCFPQDKCDGEVLVCANCLKLKTEFQIMKLELRSAQLIIQFLQEEYSLTKATVYEHACFKVLTRVIKEVTLQHHTISGF
jgi:hypothetical protein